MVLDTCTWSDPYLACFVKDALGGGLRVTLDEVLQGLFNRQVAKGRHEGVGRRDYLGRFARGAIEDAGSFALLPLEIVDFVFAVLLRGCGTPTKQLANFSAAAITKRAHAQWRGGEEALPVVRGL